MTSNRIDFRYLFHHVTKQLGHCLVLVVGGVRSDLLADLNLVLSSVSWGIISWGLVSWGLVSWGSVSVSSVGMSTISWGSVSVSVIVGSTGGVSVLVSVLVWSVLITSMSVAWGLISVAWATVGWGIMSVSVSLGTVSIIYKVDSTEVPM